MTARLRKLARDLRDAFWFLPGLMVGFGILLAFASLGADRRGDFPEWLRESAWLYSGGATGARTLLGAVASSTIAVAGTAFSITIAALTLAAGQMGPRLLRNFTADRGNQVTLGAFLGTFSYALVVLRSVRATEEGAFVPHLSLSIALALAFFCVAMLVYFVGHVASRINVDTVIDLVSEDIRDAIRRLTLSEPDAELPLELSWRDAIPVRDGRRGYLQELSREELADWAVEHQTVIRLLVRPGEYVFPGAPIALALPSAEPEAVQRAIRRATALGSQRVSSQDLEWPIRQLVEVAVRALSPGVNDPNTAISVVDRLGAALCDLARLHLPTGVVMRETALAVLVPSVDYDGLLDAMFHMIRQNARGSAAVLFRILEVLTVVATCEDEPSRRASLARHADLVLAAGEQQIPGTADLLELRRRHDAFRAASEEGAVGQS